MVEQVFEELVSLPQLLAEPNFSIEVVFIQEEEIRRYEQGRNWRRRGWVTHERRLIQVVGRRLFETPGDLAALIPAGLAEPFTASDLAAAMGRPRWLAYKIVYCLREMGAIAPAGKCGRAILYARSLAASVRSAGEGQKKRKPPLPPFDLAGGRDESL